MMDGNFAMQYPEKNGGSLLRRGAIQNTKALTPFSNKQSAVRH
jgi:hypothetical protein